MYFSVKNPAYRYNLGLFICSIESPDSNSRNSVKSPIRYQANRTASPWLSGNYGHHDYHFIRRILSRVKNLAEEKAGKGEMTVEEAGRKGGHKGGEKVKQKYGPEFYSKIGHKGGQRVRELIREGEAAEGKK